MARLMHIKKGISHHMTTHESIKEDIQTLNVGFPKVELYTLDASVIGGSVYRFTPGPLNGAAPVFNGQAYTPIPVVIEGIEMAGDGKLPRPKITISNIFKALQAEVVAYKDLIDAVLTRKRTYLKYLDGQALENPEAVFPEDVYIIKRKLKHNKLLFQFELRSPLDLEYVLIPGRQVLPDCNRVYRVWTGTAFDYTHADCPYTDTDYYTAAGVATTAPYDQCGKDLYSCKLRFPSTHNPDTQLPTRGFPGVGQFGGPYRR